MPFNRLWRQFATGLSFVVFGLGGLIVPLVIFPVRWVVRDENKREKFVKYTIHWCFRVFIQLMKGLGMLTYHVQHEEKLRVPGQLIVANHPTLIDVVFLISFLPQADCVVKSSLRRNLFTRGAIIAGRYIANDNPEDVMAAARASMARGNSLIIFPEGTRTTPGKASRLHRGAANIAISAEKNISPVTIHCTPPTLTKQTKWYHVPSRKFHISFCAGDDIDITPYCGPTRSIMSRRLTAVITDYFTREAASHE